jgi:hypothetical protein
MLLNVGSGGGAAAAAVPAGGAGAGAGAAAVEEAPKEEEKKEEGRTSPRNAVRNFGHFADPGNREGGVGRGHGLRSLRLRPDGCAWFYFSRVANFPRIENRLPAISLENCHRLEWTAATLYAQNWSAWGEWQDLQCLDTAHLAIGIGARKITAGGGMVFLRKCVLIFIKIKSVCPRESLDSTH